MSGSVILPRHVGKKCTPRQNQAHREVQSFTSQTNRNVDVNVDTQAAAAAAAALVCPPAGDFAQLQIGQLDRLKKIVFHFTLLLVDSLSPPALPTPQYQLASLLVLRIAIWMRFALNFYATAVLHEFRVQMEAAARLLKCNSAYACEPSD
jgi:hypothetical protein